MQCRVPKGLYERFSKVDDYEEAFMMMGWDVYSEQVSRHFDDDSGYFFDSKNYMRAHFGSRYKPKWRALNEEFGWFTIKEGRSNKKQWVAYVPTEKLFDDMHKYLAEFCDASQEQVFGDGTSANRLRGDTFMYHDKAGNKAVRPKRQLPRTIEVNAHALAAGKKALIFLISNLDWDRGAWPELDIFIDKEIEKRNKDIAIGLWAKMCLAQIKAIELELANPKWPKNHVPQQYRQARSGRWYPYGAGLTRYRRLVRGLALFGKYEYDLSNAGLTIMLQKVQNADSCGVELRLKGPWDAAEDYLENKKVRRAQWAKAIGITEGVLKQAIMAYIYGASYGGDAIRGIIPDASKRKLFHRECKELLLEVKKLNQRIYDDSSFERVRNNYGLNELGKGIDLCESEKPKVVAHLAQGVEAKILNAVVDSPWGDGLEVIIHDAYVFKSPIDVDAMADYLDEVTGYRVILEAE